jgi:NAD(P)H-dependent flavin oxidoreductase YrpB (nitropropane dioxygenase family)
MLKTRVTERLGIDHPILSAGFGPGAAPDLVAAVSVPGQAGSSPSPLAGQAGSSPSPVPGEGRGGGL